MNALTDNTYTRSLRAHALHLQRPRAILSISAHWYTRGTAVTAMQAPKTIHDFGGFPQALFDMQYPAPGDPQLARRVQGILEPVKVVADHAWGLDHGTWQVLVHLFPDASVPVVQLSIDATQSPAFHYELGRRLAPLREEGVLIMGSGNVVHNLGVLNWKDDVPAYDWAVRFNDVVRGHALGREHVPLVNYESLGDDARLSVPTPEHYLPLLYILGLQDRGESAVVLVDGIQNASISMLSVVIGGGER